MRRVYISGPMTGRLCMNRDAFRWAEDQLRSAGFDPLNPAANGIPEDASYEEHMRADLCMLLQADAIAVLPGWKMSRGAQIETRLASFLGLTIRPIGDYLKDGAA